MTTEAQDAWIEKIFKVAVRAAGLAAAGAGSSPDHASPHVTVIDTPIVIHGKDPPPVVVIAKPIRISAGPDAKARFKDMDHAEAAVELAAKAIVTTLHQDMHDAVGSWFRKEGPRTIDTMPDGSTDLLSGLAAALTAGITGLISASFPEVALAVKGMAILAAAEGATQTVVTTAVKDSATDAKAEAAQMMRDLADETEGAILAGREVAKGNVLGYVQALEDNSDDWDLLERGQPKDIDMLAEKVASCWGKLGDTTLLDKLKEKLHYVLLNRIKSAAINNERIKLNNRVDRGRITKNEADDQMETWNKAYNEKHGTTSLTVERPGLQRLEQVDMTRSD